MERHTERPPAQGMKPRTGGRPMAFVLMPSIPVVCRFAKEVRGELSESVLIGVIRTLALHPSVACTAVHVRGIEKARTCKRGHKL